MHTGGNRGVADPTLPAARKLRASLVARSNRGQMGTARLEAAAEAALPSGTRPRRTSARLEAAAEAALPPLLRALAGDPLRAILKLLGGADLTCARLACKDFRDHSSPAQEVIPRVDFLRTRALVVFACGRMPGFVRNLPRMLRLAASVGCVSALEELVDHRQGT
ncbi:hypothetical protein T492DRAFT_893260 [Pavlovales sp. CCMP2436]|nr:hypothetical protein T492DRAFT_893260 [Pavlovales sp. CCMP2436]